MPLVRTPYLRILFKGHVPRYSDNGGTVCSKAGTCLTRRTSVLGSSTRFSTSLTRSFNLPLNSITCVTLPFSQHSSTNPPPVPVSALRLPCSVSAATWSASPNPPPVQSPRAKVLPTPSARWRATLTSSSCVTPRRGHRASPASTRPSLSSTRATAATCTRRRR